MTRTNAQRLRNSIVLLDANEPGWRGKVNTATLNQGMASKCVLGQVYGDFWKGLRALGIDNEAGFLDPTYLFHSGDFNSCREHTLLWKEALGPSESSEPSEPLEVLRLAVAVLRGRGYTVHCEVTPPVETVTV